MTKSTAANLQHNDWGKKKNQGLIHNSEMNICSHPTDIFLGRLFMLQEDNRKQTAYSMTLQKKSLGAELGCLQSRLLSRKKRLSDQMGAIPLHQLVSSVPTHL